MDPPWRNVLLGEFHIVEDDQGSVDLDDCAVVNPGFNAEVLRSGSDGFELGVNLFVGLVAVH